MSICSVSNRLDKISFFLFLVLLQRQQTNDRSIKINKIKLITIANSNNRVQLDNGLPPLPLKKAVEAAGYSFGDEIMVALDCAASEFYVNGK